MKLNKSILVLCLAGLFPVFGASGEEDAVVMMDKIELLYFEECPSHEAVRKHVLELIEEEGWKVDLVFLEVNSDAEAQKYQFYGSPSVRVNGVDIERKEGRPVWGCRIYHIDGKTTGSPPKSYLRTKILQILAEK